ncbi:MAG: polyphosphate polymerase domain-containing protein [Myxococcales bacterium]|nr:polyphosphate polymerase domain-containing protein [Myxococcales bacterium]MCB9567064.1 polyphosphate polymerase domain-containing protein [Myxococcales bacterium]MCB9704131.1 polyphosphate polymerase domain-containing protein [Myxococcales bacterium]
MADTTPTVIERREYKYLIDARTADGIRAAIQPFCELDPWARSPARRYTIDSLYFDTSDLRLFWANDHELVDRFKLRIRGYPEVDGGPLFFEVKRRVNDVIWKTRGKVPRDRWSELICDPSSSIPEAIGGKDRAAVERFVALARTLRVRPFTLVRYHREPYFSRIDDYARVTFDFNIRAHVMNEPSFEVTPRGWRALDDAVTQRTLESMIVLELKFTSAVPIWLVDLVERFDLRRRSFSKYGTSIRAFYEPPTTRAARLVGGWR